MPRNNDPERWRASGLTTFPTPVSRASELETPHGELWIKNDGLTSALYGGNKVRKLELILGAAQSRGARRIVTVGAAGSHHALATAVFSRALGMRAAAVLCPQPATPHAERTLRDALALGLEVYPTRGIATLGPRLLGVLRPGDYFVPPGGSTVLGTRGYASAMTELAAQIERGELPEPDLIVVALGSGGTTAGLLAGALREGLKSSIVGVRIGGYAPLTRSVVVSLALRTLQKVGIRSRLRELSRRVSIEHGYAGRGYGWPTNEGELAREVASRVGLELDLTYTAKAFAKALELVGFSGPKGAEVPRRAALSATGRPLRVLYWHTLSAARPAQLIRRVDASSDMPRALGELFIHGAR